LQRFHNFIYFGLFPEKHFEIEIHYLGRNECCFELLKCFIFQETFFVVEKIIIVNDPLLKLGF